MTFLLYTHHEKPRRLGGERTEKLLSNDAMRAGMIMRLIAPSREASSSGIAPGIIPGMAPMDPATPSAARRPVFVTEAHFSYVNMMVTNLGYGPVE